MWMLDTHTCSYILRAHPARARARFRRAAPGDIAISTVVLAELCFGAGRLPGRSALREDIQQFASGLAVLPWDEGAADHYGRIRTALERRGTPIGAMDMMIGAHARSMDAVLVTNNFAHFRRVPGLLLENWASG